MDESTSVDTSRPCAGLLVARRGGGATTADDSLQQRATFHVKHDAQRRARISRDTPHYVVLSRLYGVRRHTRAASAGSGTPASAPPTPRDARLARRRLGPPGREAHTAGALPTSTRTTVDSGSTTPSPTCTTEVSTTPSLLSAARAPSAPPRRCRP